MSVASAYPEYYLSYIEKNGHSALMLSARMAPAAPIQVITELGFVYTESSDSSDLSLYIETKRGLVDEESIASQALYRSRSNIKHRTYQISQEESQMFFQIINGDRQKNLKKISGTKSQEKIIMGWDDELPGGDRYQLLTHNCKTYAMSVFKRLGIFEAKNLQNNLVQIPGSTPTLMSNLSEASMHCPLKDEFLLMANPLLQKLPTTLEDFSNNLSPNNSPSKTKALDLIKEALDLNNKIQIKKIGFDQETIQQYKSLVLTLENLCENKRFLSQLSGRKKEAKETAEMLLSITTDLKKSLKVAEEIQEKSEQGLLSFEWKGKLEFSQRDDISKFSDLEKSIYFTKTMSQEAQEGTESLMDLISEKLKISKNETETSDLMELLFITQSFNTAISNSNEAFFFKHQHIHDDDNEIIQNCLEQQENLEALTKDFFQKIKDFKSKTPAATGIVATIKQFLYSLSPNFPGLKLSPKEILSIELSKKIEILDTKKTMLFQKKQNPIEGSKAQVDNTPSNSKKL